MLLLKSIRDTDDTNLETELNLQYLAQKCKLNSDLLPSLSGGLQHPTSTKLRSVCCTWQIKQQGDVGHHFTVLCAQGD